jgi:hypothetical protein
MFTIVLILRRPNCVNTYIYMFNNDVSITVPCDCYCATVHDNYKVIGQAPEREGALIGCYISTEISLQFLTAGGNGFPTQHKTYLKQQSLSRLLLAGTSIARQRHSIQVRQSWGGLIGQDKCSNGQS